ncbi:MAG: hypothetical protein EHM14_07830 [Methanothrix sp.]|nr:MAG: hypothetical protein EHM14_07830 [Methanothrix sp.]
MLEGSIEHLDFFLILSVIIAVEGPAFNWGHRRLHSLAKVVINIVELPKETIIMACEKWDAEIFSDVKMISFAAIFLIFVHLAGIDYHELSFNSGISETLFNLGYYFAVYLEGAGFYIMIMTALTINTIGRQPLKIDALFSDFHAIGILYSKFTIYAASVYIIWGIFHMIVPPLFTSLQLILWFSGFAVLLFAYFILPQYRIHRMMTSIKKEKIDMLSNQMKAALDKSFGAPAADNTVYVKDMMAMQSQLNQMSQWPFGIQEMLRIGLIIVIPIIIIVLEIALGIIK